MKRYFISDGAILLPAFDADAGHAAPLHVLPQRAYRLREANGEHVESRGLKETMGTIVTEPHQWGSFRVVVGQTTLVDYLIDDAPTAESELFVAGWMRAYNGRRAASASEFAKHHYQWQDGYRVGLSDRKRPA